MKRMLLALSVACCAAARGAEFVIGISVDGLGSTYLQQALDAGDVPHLKRLLAEGAGTLNARTDYFMSVTLPNHTAMLTGRPVRGDDGHGYTNNVDPKDGEIIHSIKGSYVASAFDVAHDNGLRTGLWTTKTKFSLYSDSYDATHGAADKTGADNGRDKVDLFAHATDCTKLTDDFIERVKGAPCGFAFVHYGDTDAAGHKYGWGGAEYRTALKNVDDCLRRIFEMIENVPAYEGRTTVILTADHGGKDKGHSDAKLPLNFTIPFLTWGAGIAKAELYQLNAAARTSPGEARPSFDDARQPIRNGDLGNLALSELGLPAIPGSRINAKQDLRVRN